jgi:hypothetical protein
MDSKILAENFLNNAKKLADKFDKSPDFLRDRPFVDEK